MQRLYSPAAVTAFPEELYQTLRSWVEREDMRVDMKIEVVVVPVSDIERAKEFYVKLGWRLDQTPPSVFQLTPPGSACSVQFGKNLISGISVTQWSRR